MIHAIVHLNKRIVRLTCIFSVVSKLTPTVSGGNRVPIAALKYFESRSVPRLRVLVTYKSRFPDPRLSSDRSFFALHLLDESGEIRAYAYQDVALELYSRFETGKMYYISGFDRRSSCSDFYFNLPNKEIIELRKCTRIEEVRSFRHFYSFSDCWLLFVSAMIFMSLSGSASTSSQYPSSVNSSYQRST